MIKTPKTFSRLQSAVYSTVFFRSSHMSHCIICDLINVDNSVVSTEAGLGIGTCKRLSMDLKVVLFHQPFPKLIIVFFDIVR